LNTDFGINNENQDCKKIGRVGNTYRREEGEWRR
jgi:hypothetical protein